METIKVRVKPFGALPEGLCEAQRKYLGKRIVVRRVPIILGYVYEQIDPLQESQYGKWIWQEEHIIPIGKGKKYE